MKWFNIKNKCIGICPRIKHEKVHWAHSCFQRPWDHGHKMWWSHQGSEAHFTTLLGAELQLVSWCLINVLVLYTFVLITSNSPPFRSAPFLSNLTCDHGPAVQTGGQLCVLHACLLAGAGWEHWESDRTSALTWLILWTHWTCRICSPPPQPRLHPPHSPTDQLEKHNKGAAESMCTGPQSLIQTSPRELANDMITIQ